MAPIKSARRLFVAGSRRLLFGKLLAPNGSEYFKITFKTIYQAGIK